MAPRKKTTTSKTSKRPIEQYDHKGKTRVNNPPVGLVTPKTDPLATTHKTYFYDPHLDPQLQWAGKKEHLSFDVPTVSLHVHERIDPRTIIEAVRKRNGKGLPVQGYLFETKEENPPFRDAIDFYRHPHGWSNRLIAGDSLLVMNSLLEKEGMAGEVQMVYIDPPYGIRYGSNFQPFVNRRDVKDGKDEDLTQEPEMVRAFRDTWELGIHSYLSYLRDRLLLAKELLHESGSCFVQISDINLHHARELMEEVVGLGDFVSIIAYTTTTSEKTIRIAGICDFLLWYAKDSAALKFRPLFTEKMLGGEGGSKYRLVMVESGDLAPLSNYERGGQIIPQGARICRLDTVTSQRPGGRYKVQFEGQEYLPDPGYWKPSEEGFKSLIASGRIRREG